MIGTGASAIQIIPELVKVAGSVKVFQRTPGWVMPRLDLETPGRGQGRLRDGCRRCSSWRGRALFLGHEAAATGLVWNTPVTTADPAGRASCTCG